MKINMSKLFLILISGIEKWEEAITLAHECLEILQKIYGKFHPNISHQMNIISGVLSFMEGGDKKYKIDLLRILTLSKIFQRFSRS